MICNHIIWKLSLVLELPTFTNKLEIYSDGNKQYTTALLNYFKKDCLIYGQLIKIVRSRKLVDKYKRKIKEKYLGILAMKILTQSILRVITVF